MKRKNKILIGIIAVFIIIISFLFIIRENRSHRIIQAKLIDSGNLTISPIDGLHAGMLTFQNLNNGEKHTYFVCLKDLADVKLNAIYDLSANYYVPHGEPQGSMQTNGCNGPLHLNVGNK